MYLDIQACKLWCSFLWPNLRVCRCASGGAYRACEGFYSLSTSASRIEHMQRSVVLAKVHYYVTDRWPTRKRLPSHRSEAATIAIMLFVVTIIIYNIHIFVDTYFYCYLLTIYFIALYPYTAFSTTRPDNDTSCRIDLLIRKTHTNLVVKGIYRTRVL